MVSVFTKKHISSAARFMTHGMWEVDIQNLPPFQRRIILFCRRISVISNGFLHDKCLLRASSLAFTTVLSLVPFLAVVFAVSKGLGLQNNATFRYILLNVSAGNKRVVDVLLDYVNNTNVTTLGMLGVISLLITVISLMGNIEASFNIIWNVRKGRTLWRKFTDLFTTVLVAPILLGLAVSMSVTMQHDATVQGLLSIDAVNAVYVKALQFLPTVIIWLVMFFAYTFIPNTKVKARNALVGAVVGVVLWKIVEGLYVSYLVDVNNYSVLYGSFAQLPLFLIWVYFSWLIVLFGVEICYVVQYGATEEEKLLSGKTSCYEKSVLATAVIAILAKTYEENAGAVEVSTLSQELRVSQLLIRDVVEIFEQEGYVAKVDAEEPAYILARPTGAVKVSEIITTVANYHPLRLLPYSVHGQPNAVGAVEKLFKQLAGGKDTTVDKL